MNTLLDPIKVIALGEAAEGALSRLLASFGASVLPGTVAELPNVLHDADLLIDRIGTERLADAGWPQSRLRAEYPRLIHVSVTPFGSGGPYGRWLGSELVSSAMGGTLRVTGEPDRPPVKEALDACGFHADVVAASGAMAALYERGDSGLGQHIDVSVQEVAFSRNVNGVLVWQFDKRKLGRVGGALNYGRATVRCIWPLADGYCFHSLMTGRFGAPANQALSDWMDEVGVANPLRATDWSQYNRSTLDAATRASWEQAIEVFFRTRTREDIRTEGRRRGINATVVAEPADVLADPHLQAREFWTTAGDARVPGRFVSLRRATEAPVPRAEAASMKRSVPVSYPRRSGPLAGVRVLDLSWALVGSITTKILGDLGADIVKVESRTRPCLSRLDVQVSVSRADSFDDKPWFAHLNTSKRSLTLDMKKPDSREVLDPLIDWADVVVENFSPGTMAKLGLDYPRLAERNPAVIMVSGSVFGQSGPLTHEWGVDGTGAALSGRTYLTGWPDRGPVTPGAVPYGDVIVPYVMAAATAAALDKRRSSGVGEHIDAAMYEICAQQMYPAIAAASRGQRPQRQGNADPGFYHQGVYPTKGEDRWIALSIPTATDWHALCAAAGIDPAAQGDEREARLAAWTREQEDTALMRTIQSWGIPAGAVQDVQDLIEHDLQLAFRCALVTLEHPLLGPFGHVRTPLSFSRSRIEPYRAPGLGEHTDSIAQLAGLGAERITELREHGVFK